MSMITFECPDDILRSLSETPEHFADECRRLIAAKLFEIGHLSSGQAARLAGMERVAFLDALKSCKVSAVNLSAEELAQDLSHARKPVENAGMWLSEDLKRIVLESADDSS